METKVKVDAKAEALKLFKVYSNWRDVRAELVKLGVKDGEAKQVAKEANKAIHGK